MPLIYPVSTDEDLPDEDLLDDETAYEEFSADWSDTWIVEIVPDGGDEQDPVVVGPMAPRAAWDLAHDMEGLRPRWTFALVPLFEAEDAEALINQIESDD